MEKEYIEILNSVASSINIISEYGYHGYPFWMGVFQHPLGGQGRVDVHSSESGEFVFTGWVIVYEFGTDVRKITRSVLFEEQQCGRDELGKRLVDSVKIVLSWTEDDITEIEYGLEDPWDGTDREKFEASWRGLPKPCLP